VAGFLFIIPRRKSIGVLFLKKFKLFGFLAGAAVLSGFFWWFWAVQPVSQSETTPARLFVIPQGESLTSIAQRLQKEGFIRSALAFKILVLSQGQAEKIQAGDFRLSPSLRPGEIAELLTHGSLDLWLTFPEGWRREEFARRLEANLTTFDYQEFLDLTADLEGYLFPDTYLLPKEASPAAVVKILRRNFNKKFSSALVVAAKAKGLTQRQVVILASIVEREARHDRDRSLIAGILLRRWRHNWPLQADATVQYAKANLDRQKNRQLRLENWWPRIVKKDLEIDSPFNTYRYRGLPPGPICNPGLASIKAVIYPQESDYWFYLSDNEGTVHYARTMEEHLENIQRYLR